MLSTDNSAPLKAKLDEKTQQVLTHIRSDYVDAHRLRGRVRKIDGAKGFMFVAGDDGQDYFCHYSAFKKSSTRNLRQLIVADRVEFTPILPPGKNLRGIEIEYLEG